MITSSNWQLSVETEEESFSHNGKADAMRVAMNLDSGTLGGTGDAGDCVEMQFNRQHALVLYMAPDQVILRPRFPNRVESGEGVEEFFCECCGVQLGDRTELLARCTSRVNGFAICEEILNGKLPVSQDIEWVPLKPRLKSAT